MEKKDDNSMVDELVLGVLLHCRPFTHHRQHWLNLAYQELRLIPVKVQDPLGS
ncbi:hypothetical protein AXX17_AT5G42750 [Arabidopsis thaliana]|uniref:Uncharacterized protein n=1 Tax=Arabidopsis thaliana TaxID=3702 RepID=A0A178UKE0_ARATH|nr:hypothetical protein AXX17_AT5G42750 [Arabidopsis thaliana]